VLARRPDLITTFLRHENLERHRLGEVPPVSHLPYLEALATNPVFQEAYLPHRIELPSIMDLSALYVRGDSPEAAGLQAWQQLR